MKFPPNRVVRKIQVPIVRVCNKRCPECCARDQLTWYNKEIRRKDREISIDELRRVGGLIGEVDRMELTGGEPTLHTQFEEITNNLQNIFQCNDIMLVTNGWLFEKDPSKLPLLLKYQRIYLTNYTDEFVKNHDEKDNNKACEIVTEFMQANGHPNFAAGKMDSHVPFKSPPYGGGPCIFGHHMSEMISYYEGYLYGCCVAWSLPYRGKGIPLTEDWRDHLKEIEIPCEQCFLST